MQINLLYAELQSISTAGESNNLHSEYPFIKRSRRFDISDRQYKVIEPIDYNSR